MNEIVALEKHAEARCRADWAIHLAEDALADLQRGAEAVA